MLGTLTNAAAIIAGSAVGVLIHSRLPQRYVNIAFQCAGLFTLIIGLSMALKSDHMIILIVSLISGSLIGEALNIEGNTEKAANYLLKKFAKKGQNLENTNEPHLAVEGFITATMLFCTGSMAILGAFEDGMGKTPTLMYTKAILDGIASVAFASSFGISVAFSVIPILIYQGGLTLFTTYIMQFMTDTMITDLTAVGGILLVGLGISILKIKDIKVINMLPALVIVVLLSMII
ncbi:MAG: DUF554 domain-containing protein [Bacteroidales bacterium]|jgi:uncharacterized membrane protein YqgA involved in biofilm formation|nr:DUF554 domain-containing protein [Bacteroidales bacterium]